MPLPRFESLSDARRRVILEAAANEFAEHGFEGASFNRIIAAAKISKGTMYYYFADKADAYGAVMDDVLARIEASVVDLPAPHDPASYWRTLALALERINGVLFADTRLGALARSLYGNVGTGATFDRLLERMRAAIERLLVDGQRLGTVRDDVPLPLLVAVVSGIGIAVDRYFADAMEHIPTHELLRLAPKPLELLRDLLETEPAPIEGAPAKKADKPC